VAPTHYIVVEDSSDMSPDMVQRIAYKMTHLYYNWSGTVRVPAPCQVCSSECNISTVKPRYSANEGAKKNSPYTEVPDTLSQGCGAKQNLALAPGIKKAPLRAPAPTSGLWLRLEKFLKRHVFPEK